MGETQDADTDIVYPNEIRECEPCKRLWRSKQQASASTPVQPQADNADPTTTPTRKPGGIIVYPKEIENCEPCKRIWLTKHLKALRAASQASAAQ